MRKKIITFIEDNILKVFFVGLLSLVCVQAGIYRGRTLTYDKFAPEILVKEQIIVEFEEKEEQYIQTIESLKTELQHWKLVNEILTLESSKKHEKVWGDGGDSYGIAQFKKTTFYELAEKSGFYGANWKNEMDQIILLSWALRNGYGDHWSSYDRAKKNIGM
ncbi:hypothetical protein HY745_13400 [Candidatus Desantisbacteria bacterium]|nr:hypothetical protein [Candidatus Desantisbacteria bacterium]